MRHGRTVLAGVASLLVGTAALVAPAGLAAADPVTPVTVSFTTQGCSQWAAPVAAATIDVTATGAAGQAGSKSAGGDGAEVDATLAVAGGMAFTVCVDVGGGAAGGGIAGGGGGASGVSVGSDFSQPVVIAAGGGGGGGSYDGFGCIAAGGNAENAGGSCSLATGGYSGNNGGGAGFPNGHAAGSTNSSGPGTGGSGAWASNTYDGVSGGGGGGYVGGGGGGAYADAQNGGNTGGGGGGSNLCVDGTIAGLTSSGCSSNDGAGTGTGAGSNPGDANVVISYIPAVAPDAPSAPTAGVVGNSSVALSWTAPTSDGGSPITGYTVEQATNPLGPWTSSTLSGTISGTSATVVGLTNGLAYYFAVSATNAVGTSDLSTAGGPYTPHITAPVFHPGYWLAGSDGGIFAFGSARFYGSMGGSHLNAPVVGLAPTWGVFGGVAGHNVPGAASGYYEVAADGGIFAFGAARFHGSMGGSHLNAPVVGMASAPGGAGYWEVAADGGIFAFGDAQFEGSMGGSHLNAPIVGMAVTPTGRGYWLVAADGGVFAFGDAKYLGSGVAGTSPATGMAANGPTGYWVVHQNGTVTGVGTAGVYSPATSTSPVIGITTGTGGGYLTGAADGGVFAYGAAQFAGSMGGHPLNAPIVAISSATPHLT